MGKNDVEGTRGPHFGWPLLRISTKAQAWTAKTRRLRTGRSFNWANSRGVKSLEPRPEIVAHERKLTRVVVVFE